MDSMIEVGNIVTLENQKEYLLLEEITLQERRFVYAVRVLEDETPTSEYIIYGEYLKDITSKEEYDMLVEEFKDVISDKMISGEYDDMLKEGEGEE